jgi:6,7-dimethyl-8-ribityllumazine synthase
MAGSGAPDLFTVDASSLTVGIVATRWNFDLVDQMLARARAAAKDCGVRAVVEARVAGSVELPVVAQALARRCDAVVALGVVIRGETAHFDYVCRSVTDGLTRIALDESTPVAHGVLTVDTADQARDRAGFRDSSEDKGYTATVAALEAALAIRAIG